MFGKKSWPELTGNWEERGVIGTRIEIEKNRILILWRNDPVLDTEFSAKKEESGVLRLELKKNGLRYSRAASDYASVREMYWENEKLHFVEDFPITGPSEEVLTKTENSRYGNYDILDKEILPRLRGIWEDENGYWSLEFRGDTLICRGEKIPIHVLRSRSYPNADSYRIVHADPAVYEFADFGSMTYEAGRLQATVRVCDAPSMVYVFHKKES